MVTIEKVETGYILERGEVYSRSRPVFTIIEDLFACLLSEFEGLSQYNSGVLFGKVTIQRGETESFERRVKESTPPPLPKPNPKAIEHF